MGVRRALLASLPGPAAERGREPRRRDTRPAEIGDERARGDRKPGSRRRVGDRAQPQRGDRAADDPLALQTCQSLTLVARASGDLVDERGEGQRASEADPRGSQLAVVVGRVRRGRHDQQRVTPRRRHVGAEHLPRLRGVGRTEDQRQRHPRYGGAGSDVRHRQRDRIEARSPRRAESLSASAAGGWLQCPRHADDNRGRRHTDAYPRDTISQTCPRLQIVAQS